MIVYFQNLKMNLKSFPFPIHIPDGISVDAIEKSPLLSNWFQCLDPTVRVLEVNILSVDFFGKRIGFIEIEVTYQITNHKSSENEKKKTERIILSGKSCMICSILYATDTKELFTILVNQPRIGCGKIMYEYPAGMTDGSNDYRLTASRELSEEVGIKCSPEDMIPLSEIYNKNHPSYYLNYARFDQQARFYLVISKMKKSDIMNFEGKKRGADADEQIFLHVVPFEDSWLYGNEPATLAAYKMIEELIESKEITFE